MTEAFLDPISLPRPSRIRFAYEAVKRALMTPKMRRAYDAKGRALIDETLRETAALKRDLLQKIAAGPTDTLQL